MNGNTKYTLSKPVFLIGFMGAGKTTTARNLAKLCGQSSLDLDILLKQNFGISAGDMLRKNGEEFMRKCETETLNEVIGLPPQFISCGGGIIETSENIEILRDNGFVVYLKISTEEACSRITNFRNRPLLKDLINRKELHLRRLSKYENCAHSSVDVSGLNCFEVAGKIKDILVKEKVLE
ncbi:MAG: shikimate kinase [Eggerthellaceae bacterium]|nr:shikimate kinase [Eggerthellaceae bacterium]